jgi:hypothetical protein
LHPEWRASSQLSNRKNADSFLTPISPTRYISWQTAKDSGCRGSYKKMNYES